MKSRFIFTLATLAVCSFPIVAGAITYDSALATRMQGRILLQVESHGEAWYVRSKDLKRYYMKDGAAAYSIMRFFSLGIADVDLAKIPQVSNTTEMKAATSACATNSLGNRFRGEILLQVQQHGEAWYVDPVKCRAIYMKDGAVAYEVMRFLGFGVFTRDLEKIEDGGTVPGSSPSIPTPPIGEQPATSSTPGISCVTPTDTSRMDLFDSHVHKSPKATLTQIITEMNKAGVSVANLYSGTLADSAQYPGKFITFVDTPDSPQNSMWLTQGQTFVTSAETALNTGSYYGVGEANLRYYGGSNFPPGTPDINVTADTPIWLELVDLAAQHHVPISFHFVPDSATANAAFDRMMDHNKDATLIWAHLGFNNLTIDRATLNDYLLRYPHLYFDTAGLQGMENALTQPNSNWTRITAAPNHDRLNEEWRQFFETWNSRILFATDAGGGKNSLERWLNYSASISDLAPKNSVPRWRNVLSDLDSSAALNILNSNSRKLFLKEERPAYAYSVASNGQCHSVSVRSDSSVSALTYDQTSHVITFTVAESTGTTGHVVVTVPKLVMSGISSVSVDGQNVTSQTTSNSDSNTVSFDFAGGIRTITLRATGTP